MKKIDETSQLLNDFNLDLMTPVGSRRTSAVNEQIDTEQTSGSQKAEEVILPEVSETEKSEQPVEVKVDKKIATKEKKKSKDKDVLKEDSKIVKEDEQAVKEDEQLVKEDEETSQNIEGRVDKTQEIKRPSTMKVLENSFADAGARMFRSFNKVTGGKSFFNSKKKDKV